MADKRPADEARAKLADLIKGIQFAMMTTVDDPATGSLRSRPMTTQEMKDDGLLWFFTPEHSAKVDEVNREHHVNLSYADPDSNRYVSISGRATLVRDRKKNEELWNPMLKAWFPKGLDDPELSLLRVEIDAAEYWDSPSSKVAQLIGFAKAIVTGTPYSGGEHEKVDIKK